MFMLLLFVGIFFSASCIQTMELISFDRKYKHSKNNSDVTQSSSDLSGQRSISQSRSSSSERGRSLIKASPKTSRKGSSAKTNPKTSRESSANPNKRTRSLSASPSTLFKLKPISKEPLKAIPEEKKREKSYNIEKKQEKKERVNAFNNSLAHVNELNNSLIFAVNQQDITCVEGLLTCLDVIKKNGKDSLGNTACHYATALPNDTIFESFIKRPDIFMLSNNEGQKPYQATTILKRKLKLFGKASFDNCVEKWIVATLLNKSTEEVKTTDIKNVQQALNSSIKNRPKNGKKNKKDLALIEHLNLIERIRQDISQNLELLKQNLELLKEDTFYQKILDNYNLDYVAQQKNEDRTLPTSIQDGQSHIGIKFTKDFIVAWLNFYSGSLIIQNKK